MALKKVEILRRTILFLAIVISGGSLLFPRAPILFLIVVLCLHARGWRISFNKALAPILVLLAAIFLLTLLRPEGVDLQSTAVRFANFLAGLLLLDLYVRDYPGALQDDLYVILKWMTVQAIGTVALAELVNAVFLPLTIAETQYNTFLLLFNYHTMLEDSTALTRPDGFFYEPGVFQVYLNLFLYLALFVRRSRVHSTLAILAVLLTQSTTGVVICSMIVGVFIATEYVNRGTLLARIAKFTAGLLLIIPILVVTSGNIVNKMSGDAQGSYWARQYDLLTGINVIAEHPLLGIGFDYEQYYRASSRLGYAETQLPDRILQDRGNTNGVVFLLYSLGIPLALPFLVGMFRQRFFRHRWLVGGLLFLTFFGESMVFTPFFLMIIYSGLMLGKRVARTADAPQGEPLATT